MAEMKSPNVHAKKNRNDTPRKRKTHIIKVRVTAEEKLRIAYACKELHLTQSELVRRVLYGVNVKHTVVVAQGGEDALAALAALSAQCSKVGSNLNQLARHFNSGGKDTEQLRAQGKSILFISHRLEDMYRLADRVTVFRDAAYIGTWDIQEITNEILVQAMVGREIKDLYPKLTPNIGEVVLEVKHLTSTGVFHDVSFDVRKGEIFGLTGLVGAGRTEVVQTIFGVEHYDAGKVFVDGKEVHIRRPQDAMRLGIGLLTEDRQNQGLILDWGIGRNITLPELGAKFSKKGGITSETIENQAAKELAEEIDVKAVTVFDPASSLSGGNQQKVVVAKALASDLKLLIMDEPTKGVDVGAKAAIYQIMGELAQKGMAIVMISSEMPELLGMSDRIYVMCDGRVTGELSRTEATQEKILELSMLKHSGAASG